MRISDWSSDVCSSDLEAGHDRARPGVDRGWVARGMNGDQLAFGNLGIALVDAVGCAAVAQKMLRARRDMTLLQRVFSGGPLKTLDHLRGLSAKETWVLGKDRRSGGEGKRGSGR